MRKLIGAIFVVVALGSAVAVGQSSDTIKVRLPEAAVVGRTMIPAGEYVVRDLQDMNNPIVSITGPGVQLTLLANRSGERRPVDNGVTLVREGDRLRVATIWIGDEGYALLPVPGK